VPVCPLSSYSTVSELSNLLSVSTATRLFVHPNLLPIALEAASNAGLPHEHVYVLGGQVAGRKSLGDMIDEIIERKTPVVPVKPVKHNTLAYLLFSSGTSGVPKSVMVSHSNLVFQMYQNDMVEETLASASPVCLWEKMHVKCSSPRSSSHGRLMHRSRRSWASYPCTILSYVLYPLLNMCFIEKQTQGIGVIVCRSTRVPTTVSGALCSTFPLADPS
jgi:acyl-CoA synthetase (AMP-forming)/AMP-acid ligase II